MTISQSIRALLKRVFYIKKHAVPYVKRVCTDYVRTRRLWRKKYAAGTYTYTVVSAVYNSGKYLDAYFASLTSQTLDFTNNIHLILVDDGSTDNSAAIIHNWQNRFPHNITYIYKENGKQGSARNRGIPHVKTPWVTFIDPDDFVDCTYFQHVDNFFQQHHNEQDHDQHIQMLSCNLILYYEHSHRYFNKHPLRYRFTNKYSIYHYTDLDQVIQLSASTAFFSTKELRRQQLFFSEKHWPQFEDGHFVLRYLLNLQAGAIAFARLPRYYYRKRADKSSSLDMASQTKAYYLDIVQEAYLDILELAQKKNETIPLFIQRTLLYSMGFRLKRCINAPAPQSLQPEEQENFLHICSQFFSRIDDATILAFPSQISGFGFMYKIGCLAFFKKSVPPQTYIHIQHFDPIRRRLYYYYYTPCPPYQDPTLVSQPNHTVFDAKTTQVSFWGRPFVIRRQVWLDLPGTAGTLTFEHNGVPAIITWQHDKFASLPITALLPQRKEAVSRHDMKRYSNAWLLIDRPDSADDNAEHLYRFIHTNHPEQPVFFLLSSASSDWIRLQQEGFSLIDYGSHAHEKALQSSSTLISSHMDANITNYIPCQNHQQHFVCLQHGVTIHNLSPWLNQKKIDLMVTSTADEYRYFTADGSPYTLAKHQTILAGMPRHDALLSSTGNHDNTILIMPTWRKWLATQSQSDVLQSLYITQWLRLLNAPKLHEMASKHGMQIILHPHKNMRKILTQLPLQPHVRISSEKTMSIQTLFKHATVLVTDYSSVAFEMAYMLKPVLYYQFDSETFYSGAHPTQPGYYDFFRDGFGPVAQDAETLLHHLDTLLQNNGIPDPVYLDRMHTTFAFRDGKNCQRVYKAICDLKRVSA